MRPQYDNLLEMTGHESGAIYFPESGETIVCNWSGVDGIPRQFADGLIGLGEDLSSARRVAVPAAARRAMRDYEREQDTPVSRSGFRAWRVGDAIVVVQKEWI